MLSTEAGDMVSLEDMGNQEPGVGGRGHILTVTQLCIYDMVCHANVSNQVKCDGRTS